jgi:hypothetical protein
MNTSRWARSGLPLPNVADTGDTWPTVPVRVVRKFLFAGRRTVRSADGPLTLVFTSAGVSAMRIDRSGSSTPGPGRAAQMPRAHVAVKRQSFQVVRRLSGGIPEHDSGGTMVMTRGVTQRPSAFRNVGARAPGNGLWCRGATVVHRVCATGRPQARPLSIPGGHMGMPLCARPGPDDLPPQRNGSPIGGGSVVGDDHVHGHGNLGPQCKLALRSPRRMFSSNPPTVSTSLRSIAMELPMTMGYPNMAFGGIAAPTPCPALMGSSPQRRTDLPRMVAPGAS